MFISYYNKILFTYSGHSLVLFLYKKLSYRRRTARCTMSVEILSTAPKLYEKSHLRDLQ